MRIITFFVGISALAISIYYSFLWFYQSIGMPIWVSAILAGVYCIFASFVFEKAIELFQNSGKLKLSVAKYSDKLPVVKKTKLKANLMIPKSIGLLIGWAILAGFSMFCTVGGQYESFKEVEEVIHEEETILVDQSLTIERVENTLESLKAEELSLTQRLSNNEGKDYMDNYLLGEAQDRLDVVRMGLNNKINELEELTILQAEFEDQENFDFESENFFVYLRSILFNKDTDPAVKLQFWSTVIPSILIDIVAPVCFTYFLLGRDQKLKLFKRKEK